MENIDYAPSSFGDIRVSDLNDALAHHGIKGQRWGIRRFQNKDGSLTDAGRKRQTLGERIHARKVKKKRVAALEKARQVKAEKKKLEDEQKEKQKIYEEEKQKALKSGSARDLLKFRGDLTKQEMDAAWARIQWEQNITGAAEKEMAKEIAAGKARTEKFMNNVKTATDYARTGIKAWNTIANVHNALNTGNLWPKIDIDIDKGNRNEFKKFRDAKKARAEQEAQKDKVHQERADKKAKEKAEKQAKEQNEQKQNKQKQNKQKTKKEPEVERYEATGDDVFGEGTSRANTGKKNSSKKSRSKVDDIIDAEWREVSPSNLPAVYTSSGRDYANNLLDNWSGSSYLLEDRYR